MGDLVGLGELTPRRSSKSACLMAPPSFQQPHLGRTGTHRNGWCRDGFGCWLLEVGQKGPQRSHPGKRKPVDDIIKVLARFGCFGGGVQCGGSVAEDNNIPCPFSNSPVRRSGGLPQGARFHHQRSRANIQWTACHSDFRKWTTCPQAARSSGGFASTGSQKLFTVVRRN